MDGWIKTKKKSVYLHRTYKYSQVYIHDGINDDVNDNDNGKWSSFINATRMLSRWWLEHDVIFIHRQKK